MEGPFRFTHHAMGRTFTGARWRCCESRWEILLSMRYIERRFWAPTCDRCGAHGQSVDERIRAYTGRDFYTGG